MITSEQLAVLHIVVNALANRADNLYILVVTRAPLAVFAARF